MDTKGWDIVYVLSNAVTNNYLKKYIQENNTTFYYKDQNIEMELLFDSWELVPGGSNKILRFKTPVKKGKLIFNNKEESLDGICPLMEMQLDFINDNNYITNLKFNLLVVGEKAGDTQDGAVTVINPDLNNVITNPIILALLSANLSKVFIENKEEISYIFAQLDLSPEDEWMKPKKYFYIYIAPTSSVNEGYLGILSVVTNRDISKLDNSIDTTMLDNNNDTFLLMSESLFLENIIMPELPNRFGNGATINHFYLNKTSDTTGTIKNSKQLNCDTVRWGLIDYYPKWNDLEIKIQGDKLRTIASGRCKIEGLASSYINFSTEGAHQFYYNKNKTIIEFKNSSGFKVDTSLDIPWWIWLNPTVGAIAYGISAAIEKTVGNQLANNTSSYIGNLSGKVVKWSNQITEINDCILNVGFCIKGSTK
ncbi:TULIP family P47-like protein [Clostridium botulinum]|uniref:TULIP family P47-like protein n=1 Tax=Clostridium botulinum TaxID=1491 RepID=UPI0005EF5C4D|nr:TULIP family P47-like protein [Clostridium botulinum]